MEQIQTSKGIFQRIETMPYPNGGRSDFYVSGQTILIIDKDICKHECDADSFSYTLITDKQNYYMKQYDQVFRFLDTDMDQIELFLNDDIQMEPSKIHHTQDRSETGDVSPLEYNFEKRFESVYGMDASKYLWKEYPIIGPEGDAFFLDYLVRTKDGDIAVEENGIHYHHPQIIGIKKYQRQLLKQNTCAQWNIKLFRFSTEDCSFQDRIEDDIRLFFGTDSRRFTVNGILANRSFKLYEHQENILERIAQSRKDSIHTFLVVLPTAAGKSKIIEKDLEAYGKEHPSFKALILATNISIIDDWKKRIDHSLSDYKQNIDIQTYAYQGRHYYKQSADTYDYIVIDEAHHAVAPTLKRVIQYYNPDFLIGLTATDQRPDKKKLEEVFGCYQTELSLKDAMEKEIIAHANVYRIETNLDLSHVRFNGQEYVNADLEKCIRVNSRNELIATVLHDYFRDSKRQGIIFCVNNKHAAEMERILNQYDLSARAYTRLTKNPKQVMEDFRNQKIRFLCACNMISEGWDYPELGILVMARPTLSRVLYLQQIGRGLRKTSSKKNVYVIDVVDEYGAMAKPCSMHTIFQNTLYVPFGDILKRDYHSGDLIEIDGMVETVQSITEVDIETYEAKYGNYLNQEQLARDLFMSTGTIVSWIKKGHIEPDVILPFGQRKIYLFSPENVIHIREEHHISEHTDDTIKEDFFSFLEERDYSLSYKMPFLLSFIHNMNRVGDARIEDILKEYIAFYQDRVNKGLPVDRSSCPYNETTLKDEKYIRTNMLTNPFEKFERKRFLYYSKDLGMISMKHALFSQLNPADIKRIEDQMHQDLENYYKKIL